MTNYKCKIMIDRINLILKAKNITARQFAEEIGIQPSGMSHILGGRNNPSLDFVTKVIRRYPEIDANWLLMGRGEMYSKHQPQEATLFPEFNEELSAPLTDTPVKEEEPSPTYRAESPTPQVAEPSDYVPTYMAVPPADILPPAEEPAQTPQPSPASRPVCQTGRRMVRLLFVYDDGTFEECLPR